MRHFSPELTRPLMCPGVRVGMVRPAISLGQPRAAEARIFTATRTFEARAVSAALLSIFERALADAVKAALRVWSDINDHAHVDRRAPPGRNPGGRRQGKPD